jgi:hypothetical protein
MGEEKGLNMRQRLAIRRSWCALTLIGLGLLCVPTGTRAGRVLVLDTSTRAAAKRQAPGPGACHHARR